MSEMFRLLVNRFDDHLFVHLLGVHNILKKHILASNHLQKKEDH